MHGDRNDETDVFLSTLSDARRRWVVRYVGANHPTDLKTIADDLAAYEDTDRRGVYSNLYQHHILILDASDIVDYNDRSKEITRGPKHSRALEILEFVDAQVARS